MFSKLLSFFLPKENTFVDKDELDLLVGTVSKGFQTHRDRLVAIEQTADQTNAVVTSFDSRLAQVESSNASVDDIRSAVLATQTQQNATENSIADVSETVDSVQIYAKTGFSEMTEHIASLDARIKQMESQQFLTRADLEGYHNSVKESLDSRFDAVGAELKKTVDKQLMMTSQEKPQVQKKEVLVEVERDIDVSNLTHLEKNILKTLVELKVNNNITSITITDLTNRIYPEGVVTSKRPTVSAYVSKLALSGFLKKERKNNSVFISIMKEKVINYFTHENYSHLKRVI
ncbi:MAG: hypothetical protein GQ477_01075 [Nanohaloarchaea archaeon]|nr:hypothetical protein [Candidatus Nanohaloarchaea archaeon]